MVIAGYGYAGGIAAIEAHDAGAQVILVEKASHYGGNSMVSGGGVVTAKDPEKALRYLEATNAGRTPRDVNWAMAQGLCELEDYLRWLIEGLDPPVELELYDHEARGATYPFPGGETLTNIKLKPIPGFSGYPWAAGLRAGARLFKVVADNVERRKIAVYYNTAAERLITDDSGSVIGLLARQGNQRIRILARRAVVLATGGFEWDESMKKQYFEIPVFPVCTPTNTGDGVRMAQAVGAALWHMWHFHGGYGFKFPEFPFAFRHCFRGPRKPRFRMPWIAVDKYGSRFMNEYPPAVQDTGARPLAYFDADRQEYPRIPCYLIFDESGRKLGPLADTIINTEEYRYQWSEDNSVEIDCGWIKKANSIPELAKIFTMEPSVLTATVDRWNKFFRQRKDEEYGRQPSTMMAIEEPSFYAVESWPIVTNTQGGPVHDARQQIVNSYGEPVPRLYVAGELGSLFGYLYLEAGNNAECLIGGRITGRNAAGEAPWTTE